MGSKRRALRSTFCVLDLKLNELYDLSRGDRFREWEWLDAFMLPGGQRTPGVFITRDAKELARPEVREILERAKRALADDVFTDDVMRVPPPEEKEVEEEKVAAPACKKRKTKKTAP